MVGLAVRCPKQLFLADKDRVGTGCIAGFYMAFPLGLYLFFQLDSDFKWFVSLAVSKC